MQPQLDLTIFLPSYLKLLWAERKLSNEWFLTVPPVPTLIPISSHELAIVLRILIDNAIQHGQAGTPVKFTVMQRGPNILFTVENEGQNIPEHQRGQVFETPGKCLSLAAHVVRSAGGKIVAMPRQGGARIAMLFPALVGQAEPLS